MPPVQVLGVGGGEGAMEMLAVQLKSSGAYLARSLGLRGVDFHMGVVELSEAQRRMYDQSARMWRDIWEHVTNNAHAFSGGVTAIVTHAQNKFYQQLILAFKVPEIKRHTRRALRAGKCVVIGLQSTGEARLTEALSKASSD